MRTNNINKDIWRSLQSILVKNLTDSSSGRSPTALYSTNQESFTLWVGGIATDNNNILKTVESSFQMPALGKDEIRLQNAISRYSDSIEYAEKFENRLKNALKVYNNALKKNTLKKNIGKGTTQYWSILEKHQNILMKFFDEECDSNLVASKWKEICSQTAVNSFANTCPHQTPKMIIAFAKARTELFKQFTKKGNENE